MSLTSDPLAVDVVIVGGGIGGLSSALALARTGKTVRVLERADQFGEIGAGLQLAPNATRRLRSWGLLDEVIERGVLPQRLTMRDAVDASELTSLDLLDVESRYGSPYVVIHRSDLHSVLLEACRAAGVELVTGVRVDDVKLDAHGADALSADRVDRGQAILAADGINSMLRSRISNDSPVSSAYVAYRGAVPMGSLDTSALELNAIVFYVGPQCHLVQYPLRQGEVFNQVAVFRSPRALAGEPNWGTPDELDAAFAGTCAVVRDALPHLGRERWWPMYDRNPIDRWVDGRLALTGDAAHPVLQYLAQGACQAIEDADTFAGLVEKFSDSNGSDWDAALEGYAQARIGRTAQVQRRARDWGELWHTDGLFRTVRNAMLRERDPHDYRHIDWLYEV